MQKSFVTQPQHHDGSNGPRDASTGAESLRQTMVAPDVGAFPQAIAEQARVAAHVAHYEQVRAGIAVGMPIP
jgi:hypothetical protein